MPESLIHTIIAAEWDMFQHVQNQGGRASCQDDYDTFAIMRKSQFLAWSHEALASYRQDLTEARAAGRNLLTEKYGYMMEHTAPEEYENIRSLLPAVPPEKAALVAGLTEKEILWREDFNRRFPDFGRLGRPLRKEDAACGETSIETYAMGELNTYSERTLKLLAAHYQKLEAQGENPAVRIMDATARQYGYRDSADAQARLAQEGGHHGF